MPNRVTLAEIFASFLDTVKDEVWTCLPATVTAVYPDRQTVDVQPAIKNPLFSNDGKASFEELPALSDIPLGVMRGGGFFVWLPVEIGDSVMLMFSKMSLDTWRSSSGEQPVAPQWVGKLGFSGAIAVPCVAPDVAMFTTIVADAGKVIIGKDAGPAQLKISDTDIELGTAATDRVALASIVDGLITVLTATTYTPSGTETGFAAFLSALAAWKLTYIGTTGSTVTKTAP